MGVDMSMKVGRGGIVVIAIVGAATLLSTSTPAAFGLSVPSRNLNLRLPGRAPLADLDGNGETDAVAWKITGSARQAYRAAHALTWDSSLQASPLDAPSRLIVVGVRIGRRPQIRVLTNARTVGGLVNALGLGKRASVRSTPDERSALRSHQLVRISTVRRIRRTAVENLPFETLIQYSRDLSGDEVRVEQAGEEGRARRTYLITFRDGVRTSTRLLEEKILQPPVDRIEVHAAPLSGTEAGQASWYGCDGMHAAHKTLPFGTVVTVTNVDNGASVTVTINDRGPFVEGRIIDLCDGAFAQIAPLGQGVASVRISY
jgi:rare lipoprotein A